MNLQELGEFGWIERSAARLKQREGVLLGIGDDAALLAPLQTPMVACDALIENVHFRRDWTSPFLLGRKSLSVNVSDLAAKGAHPVAAFVTLGLSSSFLQEEGAAEWLDALYEGLEDAAQKYLCTIAGGDTVKTGSEIMISVTVVGEVSESSRKSGAPFFRSGAQVGDVVFVTGNLGDAAAGLFLLQHPEVEVSRSARQYLLDRHFNPRARLREMKEFLQSSQVSPALSATLDLSDGLAGDAGHIAKRSRLQIEIETVKLPISEACREAAQAAQKQGFDVSAEAWALWGGEDYEILCCASEPAMASVWQGNRMALNPSAPELFTEVGRCTASEEAPAVVLIDADGHRRISPKAWTHF